MKRPNLDFLVSFLVSRVNSDPSISQSALLTFYSSLALLNISCIPGITEKRAELRHGPLQCGGQALPTQLSQGLAYASYDR
jgi:hypothetical protein